MKKLFKQISVWLENKPGVLSKFIDLLMVNDIEIRAVTVAKNEEYGLALLLVNKPDELHDLLEKEDMPYSITKVIAVIVKPEDETKGLKEISKILGENHINIEYLYSTLVKDEPLIILHVDNNEKAKEILKKDGFLLEEREAF